ncbi:MULTISPECIES: hypothetical protein [Streptomyces]|uniref:hypothetical protein n=1 Tax=Streptomyces TaxID=1883 RepID=UPI0007CD9697
MNMPHCSANSAAFSATLSAIKFIEAGSYVLCGTAAASPCSTRTRDGASVRPAGSRRWKAEW